MKHYKQGKYCIYIETDITPIFSELINQWKERKIQVIWPTENQEGEIMVKILEATVFFFNWHIMLSCNLIKKYKYIFSEKSTSYTLFPIILVIPITNFLCIF